METLDPEPLPVSGLMPLPASKGTLVVLHGQLPHRSGPNLSDRSRHAYTLHLIDGKCRYSPDNWLQRGAGYAAARILTGPARAQAGLAPDVRRPR